MKPAKETKQKKTHDGREDDAQNISGAETEEQRPTTDSVAKDDNEEVVGLKLGDETVLPEIGKVEDEVEGDEDVSMTFPQRVSAMRYLRRCLVNVSIISRRNRLTHLLLFLALLV